MQALSNGCLHTTGTFLATLHANRNNACSLPKSIIYMYKENNSKSEVVYNVKQIKHLRSSSFPLEAHDCTHLSRNFAILPARKWDRGIPVGFDNNHGQMRCFGKFSWGLIHHRIRPPPSTAKVKTQLVHSLPLSSTPFYSLQSTPEVKRM
jgi:hypothetical protein